MDKYQRALLENGSNGKFFSCTPIKKHSISLDSKLENLNLKKSVLNILRTDGRRTVADLAKYTEDGLLKLKPNVAYKYSTDVLQELSSAGVGSNFFGSDFDYDTDIYKLIQDDDIFSTKYCFTLKSNMNIETCTVCTNGNWITVEQTEECFSVMLDFENRVEKVKLTFADNIVDEYIFSIQYVEADKDLYYQKQAEEKRNTYIEAAQIKHSTGADLVNIYFQPCCSDCGKTEIELWIAKGTYAPRSGGKCFTPSYNPQLTGGEPEQMIAKFSMEEGFLFKAINGLANGVYAYRVRQFSKDNEMLFESDYQFFDIRPQGSGRPMGHINRI